MTCEVAFCKSYRVKRISRIAKKEANLSTHVKITFSGLKTYFICGRVSPEINPIKTRPEPASISASKPTNLVLQTDAINYQMAKSLPSLSTYLHKNNSAMQIASQNSENNICNVDHENVIEQVNSHSNGDQHPIVRLNSDDDNNRKNKIFASSAEDANCSDLGNY